MALNRRKFLGLAGASLASLPFSTRVAYAKSDKRLGVALLGLGYYSEQLLAPALQLTQHCSLKGVITGSPEKIPKWQARYNLSDRNTYQYENLADIANNHEIDVVYVVTPTATHLEFAIAAANAGKHVWCEKPMAMTTEECQSMIDVCAKNKVKLSIGYRMQHEPNTRTFAQFNRTLPFGPMNAIRSFAGYAGRAGKPDYWRMQRKMGGGALYDMGVYAINGARFLSGLEPVAVKARFEPADGFDDVDATSYFTLQFANGLQAECGTSVVKSFNRLTVDCKDGWYRLSPMQSYTGVVGKTSAGIELPAFTGNQQAKQMDDDALAILNNTPVMVPGVEGLKDIKVVQGALKSAQTNKDFVRL